MNISVSQLARTGFIGQPVLRREDARLLTCRGLFT